MLYSQVPEAIKNTRDMIKQRMILALLLSIFFMSSVSAQFSKVKRARQHMEDLNYMAAIELYNQILEKGDNPEAKSTLQKPTEKLAILKVLSIGMGK